MDKKSVDEDVKYTNSFIDVFNLSSCLYEAENIQIHVYDEILFQPLEHKSLQVTKK